MLSTAYGDTQWSTSEHKYDTLILLLDLQLFCIQIHQINIQKHHSLLQFHKLVQPWSLFWKTVNQRCNIFSSVFLPPPVFPTVNDWSLKLSDFIIPTWSGSLGGDIGISPVCLAVCPFSQIIHICHEHGLGPRNYAHLFLNLKTLKCGLNLANV